MSKKIEVHNKKGVDKNLTELLWLNKRKQVEVVKDLPFQIIERINAPSLEGLGVRSPHFTFNRKCEVWRPDPIGTDPIGTDPIGTYVTPSAPTWLYTHEES